MKRNHAAPFARRLGALCVVTGSLALLTSCKEEAAGDDCVDNQAFFRDEIWTPILSENCIQCHRDGGQADGRTDFILKEESSGPKYIEENLAAFARINLTVPSMGNESLLLLKPTNTYDEDDWNNPHEGAERFTNDSAEADAFRAMIDRLNDPVECSDSTLKDDEFFEGVALLSPQETLRKASLSLVGRLPNRDEEQLVRDGGMAALDTVLDGMMEEDAFYVRLKEIWNDHFLTDRYLPNTEALNLLDGADYGDLFWFDQQGDDDRRNFEADQANDATAREALELIAHVVRNDRPFSEILTADYMVVNPFSARSYGVFDDIKWSDPDDPNEFHEAKLSFTRMAEEGGTENITVPHAGVLTSSIFLNRFPTTPTNRNRHRSRMVYEFFLATDVQRLASRPLDPQAITGDNPTRDNPQCTLCHGIVDPIAATFQNWDDTGRYNPNGTAGDNRWYPEMVPAGFGEQRMPDAEASNALQWLAKQVAADPRFPVATTRIAFKGLSGQEPLREPPDANAEGYLESLRAFQVQQRVFEEISADFVEQDFNLKALMKGLIKSPYYRANNAVGEMDEIRDQELAQLGTGRLLTPEQLDRKIRAVTGYPWQRDGRSPNYLLDMNWYRIFYGGIDSDSVVQRITEPNGIMANVGKRMANEVACWTTARDFTLPPSKRILFPFVDHDYEPEDANGFEVPASSSAIKANIQYLHQRFFGEFLEINDPEINRTYELFLHVWEDGRSGLASGDYETRLGNDCQARSDFWTGNDLAEDAQISEDPRYTVRAWMAVMTYMLSDYRFLHE